LDTPSNCCSQNSASCVQEEDNEEKDTAKCVVENVYNVVEGRAQVFVSNAYAS
jgi:hypothetical protein